MTRRPAVSAKRAIPIPAEVMLPLTRLQPDLFMAASVWGRGRGGKEASGVGKGALAGWGRIAQSARRLIEERSGKSTHYNEQEQHRTGPWTGYSFDLDKVSVTTVPEPAAMGLLGVVGAGIADGSEEGAVMGINRYSFPPGGSVLRSRRGEIRRAGLVFARS